MIVISDTFTIALSNVIVFNWVIQESVGETGKRERARMEWLVGDWLEGMVGGWVRVRWGGRMGEWSMVASKWRASERNLVGGGSLVCRRKIGPT